MRDFQIYFSLGPMKFAISATASLVLLAFVYSTPANEGPPPAITPETLVGVWEAAPSWAQRVYRLDIARAGILTWHLRTAARTWSFV